MTAASIFAAGTFAAAAHADGVECGGSNACKRQGITETNTSLECTAMGGEVL